MKLVGYAQAKNELRSGHLVRFLENFSRVVDEFVIYDDGSDDGSQEVYKKYTPHVIQGPGNEFRHESKMSQACLDYCRQVLRGDWCVWQDCDALFDRAATDESALRKLIDRAETSLPPRDGWTFHYINTYLNPWWKRMDDRFDDLLVIAMFRLTSELQFDLTPGLHRARYPRGIEQVGDQMDTQIIHLGFSSPEYVTAKYRQYKNTGQNGWALDRLINTDGMVLEKLPDDIFPRHWKPEPCNEIPKYDFSHLKDELMT
jgi:glycosyltransferase involved in cell wall biosynthesis